MNSKTLYVYETCADDPLSAASSFPDQSKAVGWLMTPRRLVLVRSNGNAKWAAEDVLPPLEQLYELTLFCDDWELQARRNGAQFQCRVTSEKDMAASLPGWTVRPLAFSTTIPGESLVWGKYSHGSGPWVDMQENRIGTMKVPRPAGPALARIALQSFEYVARDGASGAEDINQQAFGNAHIIGRRNLGFIWHTGEPNHE